MSAGLVGAVLYLDHGGVPQSAPDCQGHRVASVQQRTGDFHTFGPAAAALQHMGRSSDFIWTARTRTMVGVLHRPGFLTGLFHHMDLGRFSGGTTLLTLGLFPLPVCRTSSFPAC